MDFKKLGQQVGKIKRQAEDRLGDRAEPENLKRDGKQLRDIMSGDGSLAEKAKEAKEKLSDPDRGTVPADAEAKPATEAPAPAPTEATAPAETPAAPSGTPENATGEKHGKRAEPGQ